MLVETTTYLGPARVTEIVGAKVRLTFSDHTAWATLAIPYPYQPVVEDVVLALGQGETYYVIGVIEGTGMSIFTAPGNLEFRAPWGTIQFRSPKGIRLTGGTLDLQAKELNVTAECSTEKYGESNLWVKDSIQVRAGDLRQMVTGKWNVKADRIVQTAEKDVQIDGKQINLG